jgi:hypothetical protein
MRRELRQLAPRREHVKQATGDPAVKRAHHLGALADGVAVGAIPEPVAHAAAGLDLAARLEAQ